LLTSWSAWQKNGRTYTELRNESRLELRLSVHYSAVIALGISNESHTETQSKTAWKCLVSHLICDNCNHSIASVFRPH